MPGFLLHTGAVMQCTHGIPSLIPPAQPRVLVSGQPVATLAAKITVLGCPFTVPGPKPQPCVSIKWLMPTTRVLVAGVPALVQPTPGPGPGVCLSPFPEQLPNGPPMVAFMQPRVFAT
jgi:hypothetical protein